MAKTYDTYQDSGIAWIGEIPSEWEVVRQKNVFTLGKELIGDNWATTQLLSLTTKGIKCISIGNTSGKVPDSYNTYQTVKPNNLVMCLFDLDCSAVFSGISSCSGMISPAYKVLTVNEGADPRYYSYWFDFIFDGRKYMYLSKNIRYSLTYDEFAALGIVYPSLSEQQSIATFLDTKCVEIDALISLQEEMISELQAYKQSVITEAVTKGLNPNAKMKDSGVEWIGEIPERWNISPLKHIINDHLQYGANERGILYEEGLPRYVRITDILDNRLRDDIQKQSLTEEQAEGFILRNNDILFARSGGTVGKTFIYKTKYGKCAFAGYLIKASVNDLNNAEFVYFYTQSSSYDEWKKRIFIQATIQNIGADKYSLLEIPLPSKEEQTVIVKYLKNKTSQIDSLIALKQEKIQELKDYKKSIIYEYVTGKKRV